MELIDRIELQLAAYAAVYEMFEECEIEGITGSLMQYDIENRLLHKTSDSYLGLGNDPDGKVQYRFTRISREMYNALLRLEEGRISEDQIILFVIYFLLPQVIFESFNNHKGTKAAIAKVLSDLTEE